MAERIWFLTELYHPERTSTGFIITRIAEGLAAEHRVGVICAQPTYAGRGRRAPKREAHHGVTIIRCRSTTFERSSLVLRTINMLTITLSIFFRALAELQRDDLVIVGTNPPLLALAGALACRVRGASCIHLVHDVYPDAAIAAGVLGERSLIARVLRAANGWLYRSSHRIVTLGRDMQALVRARLGEGDREKVVVIPNWGEIDAIKPRSRLNDPIGRAPGLEGRLVFEYYGNMGRTHGIEDLLAAAEAIEDDSRAHFLFVGSGVRSSMVREHAARSGRITFAGEPDWEEQAAWLAACDVGLLAFLPGMRGVSVPSRMYAFMAAGKPILAIADPDSELALVIGEERIGWVVEPRRIDQVREIVRRIENDQEELREMGRRARSAVERRFSFGLVSRQWQALIRECRRESEAG